MKLFIIHRFTEKHLAKKHLKNFIKSSSLQIKPIYLRSSIGEKWKEKAITAISNSEAVIVFNPRACEKSDNTKWEIEKAKELNKEIIELNQNDKNTIFNSKIQSLYELKDEFENCFSSNKKDVFELYKLMIDSSESLIQRRQRTNAFFITVISMLFAVVSLLVKIKLITTESLGVLFIFSAVGLLLCHSWRNLIDNYGKLNKAKFDVILRLEQTLSTKIYLAEWISLGKGLRSKKYKSFTATEKNIPLFFGLLILCLTLIGLYYKVS